MYHICTEDVNRDGILAILEKHFTGFALYPGTGFWKGAAQTYRENSLTIEVADAPASAVRAAAQEIKHANNQEAVLVIDIPTHSVFV